MPLLSTRNSILPAFSSFTAFVTSIVTVPALGFGISPRGPRILPSAPSCPMTSGVATMTSVSSQPSLIFATYSRPTKSAPAATASSPRVWRPPRGTACRACASALHRQAHGARRPGDHVDRAFEVGRVQVLHLDLGDLLELGPRHLPHLLAIRGRRTLLDPRFLL